MRKPASNHPDYAGLNTTSVVTSMKNKLNLIVCFIFFLRRPVLIVSSWHIPVPCEYHALLGSEDKPENTSCSVGNKP